MISVVRLARLVVAVFAMVATLSVSVFPAIADGGPFMSEAGNVLGPEFSYAPAPLIVAVQSRLADLGYYEGKIDGIWGNQSSYAFWEFCRVHRLRAPNGLTSKVMMALWGKEPSDTSGPGLTAYWQEIGVKF